MSTHTEMSGFILMPLIQLGEKYNSINSTHFIKILSSNLIAKEKI
jgi:hypothetical protein